MDQIELDAGNLATVAAKLTGVTNALRPEPSGNGKPSEPTPIINHPIQFADGYRIRVIVEAWTDRDFYQATDAYCNMRLLVLDEIEFPDD